MASFPPQPEQSHCLLPLVSGTPSPHRVLIHYMQIITTGNQDSDCGATLADWPQAAEAPGGTYEASPWLVGIHCAFKSSIPTRLGRCWGSFRADDTLYHQGSLVSIDGLTQTDHNTADPKWN